MTNRKSHTPITDTKTTPSSLFPMLLTANRCFLIVYIPNGLFFKRIWDLLTIFQLQN